MPHVGAIVTSQSLTNAKSFLPPDLIGWEKRNTVLMHPETMAKLHILPRDPCWLTDVGTSGNNSAIDVRCVTVWPCDEVIYYKNELLPYFSNCNLELILQFFATNASNSYFYK